MAIFVIVVIVVVGQPEAAISRTWSKLRRTLMHSDPADRIARLRNAGFGRRLAGCRPPW